MIRVAVRTGRTRGGGERERSLIRRNATIVEVAMSRIRFVVFAVVLASVGLITSSRANAACEGDCTDISCKMPCSCWPMNYRTCEHLGYILPDQFCGIPVIREDSL